MLRHVPSSRYAVAFNDIGSQESTESTVPSIPPAGQQPFNDIGSQESTERRGERGLRGVRAVLQRHRLTGEH